MACEWIVCFWAGKKQTILNLYQYNGKNVQMNESILTFVYRPWPLISRLMGKIPPLDRRPGIKVSASSCIQSAARIVCSGWSKSYKCALGSFSGGSRMINAPKWPLTLWWPWIERSIPVINLSIVDASAFFAHLNANDRIAFRPQTHWRHTGMWTMPESDTAWSVEHRPSRAFDVDANHANE